MSKPQPPKFVTRLHPALARLDRHVASALHGETQKLRELATLRRAAALRRLVDRTKPQPA